MNASSDRNDDPANQSQMIPRAAALFERLPRTLRRHRLMTGWMKMTGEDPLQLVRIRDNHFGYADLSDGFLRLIVIEGDFEQDFFKVGDAFLSAGGTFLDVGANHGLLSFGLAGRYGDKIDFHLFEPNPKLLESIKLSSARYPSMRCHLNAVAVSDHEGTVPFAINHAQTGVSHVADDGAERFNSTTLDQYLLKSNIDQVELLKLDIEGHELLALRGAIHSLESRVFQGIYFEYFEKLLAPGQPPQELLEFLKAFDYEVCFCRACDINLRGVPTHTVREGLPGHGISLLPVQDHALPEMTDLLAIPAENLTPIQKNRY